MAITSTYPIILPKPSDLIVGTQTYTSANPVLDNPTRNFTVQSLVNLANAVQLGYTSLVQLLNQTGTNAPIATEVYNNTGETYTWSYIGQGTYRITGAGSSFAVNKTVVFLNTGETGSAFLEPLWERISDAIIEVRVGTNGSITNGSFEVKIYN